LKGSFLSRSLAGAGLAIVAAATTLAAGPATAKTERHAIAPRIDRLGREPFVRVRDRVLAGDRRLAAARVAASHGGVYTTANGEQVKVFVSDAYPVDDTVNQHWADFIGALLHGKEIAKVTVYVAPFSEMQSACQSTEADGCYLFQSEQIVVPGDPPDDGVPIEEIVAHEYGHHIALNRSNWPWQAVEWGTKRWASYENVCARVLSHTAFPGDEGLNYFRNPGEAFAESYRVLSDQRASLSSVQLPWRMDGFTPDQTALDLLAQDVQKPWTGTYISHWRGRLGVHGVRRLVLQTPHDGYAKFVLQGRPGTAIAVLDPKTGRPLGAATKQIRYGICGERRLTLAVVSVNGSKFAVTIARP
jgi:hypothetical protein